MRQFKKTGAAAFVVASVLLAVAACQDQQPVGVVDGPSLRSATDEEGDGSHFRYATLSWAPTGNPGEVQFRLIAAFRRTAYFTSFGRCLGTCAGGLPGPGDIIIEGQGPTAFNFGDGSAVTPTLRFLVSAIDVSSSIASEHWVVGEALDPVTQTPGILHSYGAGSFTAFLAGFFSTGLGNVACCRIGQLGLVTLNNRSGGSYPIQTVVDLSGNSSPTSTMLPIVSVPEASNVQFLVPAADPDGDPLSFVLATAAEAGSGSSLHPPGLTVDASTGVVSWNNTGLSQTGFWTTQVVVEDGNTKTPVDFLLRITGVPVGTPPACAINPAGPVAAAVGSPVSVTVSASDAEGDVTLNSAGLPAGATMTPGLPVTGPAPSSTFDWTPAAGQEGTHVVLFAATDIDNQQGFCSVTIEVNIVGADGGNVTVIDENGDVQGTVNIPAGAFPQNTVIIATITEDPDCANVDGGTGLCLTIIIPSGTNIAPGFFVTIGLCLDDISLRPDWAIFRTDDDGTVVLQNVQVELDCSTTGASNLGANPLTRFARGLWQKITGPFRPQVLYATFGDEGVGGLSSEFSDFQWSPTTRIDRAHVKVRTNESAKDEFDLRGTLLDGAFNPAIENFTITFGECTEAPAPDNTCPGAIRQVIPGIDFVREGKKLDKLVFKASKGASGITRVEIRDDERFRVKAKKLDLTEIVDLDDPDERFISVMIEIGDHVEGVGILVDEKGRWKFGEELVAGVEDLIEDVESLDGLGSRDLRKLLKDLDKAKKDLAKGNTKGAAKKLESFIKQLAKLVDKDVLLEADVELLIEDAQFVIDIINDPSTGT